LQGLAEFVLSFVNVESSLIRLSHFFCVSSILTASAEIPADTSIVSFIAEIIQFAKSFCFHHEINSFWLLVVVDELWNNDIDKFS